VGGIGGSQKGARSRAKKEKSSTRGNISLGGDENRATNARESLPIREKKKGLRGGREDLNQKSVREEEPRKSSPRRCVGLRREGKRREG